jgi:hypothetical protein
VAVGIAKPQLVFVRVGIELLLDRLGVDRAVGIVRNAQIAKS